MTLYIDKEQGHCGNCGERVRYDETHAGKKIGDSRRYHNWCGLAVKFTPRDPAIERAGDSIPTVMIQ
jgi:hypothetical protein